MKSYKININTVFFGDHNHPHIFNFLKSFSDCLYAGKGGVSTFLKSNDIDADFPLRCMVGIPEGEFTYRKKVLAETFCKEILGADSDEIWTTEVDWIPLNANRKIAALSNSILDVEFMSSIWPSGSFWNKHVLMTTNPLERHYYGADAELKYKLLNERFLCAFSVYGFRNPWEFFTAIK